MARCDARTQDGTPCKNRVTRAGERCYRHRGWATASAWTPSRRQQPQRPASTNRPTDQTPYRRRADIPHQRPPATTDRDVVASGVAAARERRERERRQRQRVEESASLCSEVVTSGWQEAVADRAADYVTQATLRRLVRRRLKRQCKALPQLASAILAGKQKSHDLVGRSAGWLASPP